MLTSDIYNNRMGGDYENRRPSEMKYMKVKIIKFCEFFPYSVGRVKIVEPPLGERLLSEGYAIDVDAPKVVKKTRRRRSTKK